MELATLTFNLLIRNLISTSVNSGDQNSVKFHIIIDSWDAMFTSFLAHTDSLSNRAYLQYRSNGGGGIGLKRIAELGVAVAIVRVNLSLPLYRLIHHCESSPSRMNAILVLTGVRVCLCRVGLCLLILTSDWTMGVVTVLKVGGQILRVKRAENFLTTHFLASGGTNIA